MANNHKTWWLLKIRYYYVSFVALWFLWHMRPDWRSAIMGGVLMLACELGYFYSARVDANDQHNFVFRPFREMNTILLLVSLALATRVAWPHYLALIPLMIGDACFMISWSDQMPVASLHEPKTRQKPESSTKEESHNQGKRFFVKFYDELWMFWRTIKENKLALILFLLVDIAVLLRCLINFNIS